MYLSFVVLLARQKITLCLRKPSPKQAQRVIHCRFKSLYNGMLTAAVVRAFASHEKGWAFESQPQKT